MSDEEKKLTDYLMMATDEEKKKLADYYMILIEIDRRLKREQKYAKDKESENNGNRDDNPSQ